ncbi:MAG: porin family protein, partial [Sulfurovum sp.]|nr:porin family protein [Sulfurovum sp.]
MNKITLSLVSIMALGGLAFAGGDLAPVEPVVETQVVIEDNSAFYLV